jgi:hypothetical protein
VAVVIKLVVLAKHMTSQAHQPTLLAAGVEQTSMLVLVRVVLAAEEVVVALETTVLQTQAVELVVHTTQVLEKLVVLEL